MWMRLCGAAVLIAVRASASSVVLVDLRSGQSPESACAATGVAANVTDENSAAIASLIFGALGAGSRAAVGTWYGQTYGGGCLLANVSTSGMALALSYMSKCPADTMVVCGVSPSYGVSSSTATKTVTQSTTVTRSASRTETESIQTTTTSTDVLIDILTTTSTSTPIRPTQTFAPLPDGAWYSASRLYVVPNSASDFVPFDQAALRCEYYGLRLAYVSDPSDDEISTLTDGNFWILPQASRTTSFGTFVVFSNSASGTSLLRFELLGSPASSNAAVCEKVNSTGNRSYYYATNGTFKNTPAEADALCQETSPNGNLAAYPAIATGSSISGIPEGSIFTTWSNVTNLPPVYCAAYNKQPMSPFLSVRLILDATLCTNTRYPVCLTRPG